MRIEKYDSRFQDFWDAFIEKAINASFQFKRDFINYHGEKFVDNSLMIFEKEELVACIAGHAVGSEFHSHQGLSFGGILLKKDNIFLLKKIVEELISFLKECQFTAIRFRGLPGYLHTCNEEINYYFMENGAIPIHNRLTSLVNLKNKVDYNLLSRREIKKVIGNSVEIRKVNDLPTFYNSMVIALHEKYGVKPVHNLHELTELMNKFPNNIELWELVADETISSGCILFLENNYIKLQYFFSNTNVASRKLLDFLFQEKRYMFDIFDLGTSNSLSNNQLNLGNYGYKKSMSGQPAVVYSLHLDLTTPKV